VTERLDTGDRAPDFSLTDDRGNQVKLGDYHGERVIVYFYPAAMTPGCTTEACDFRDNLRDFDEANVRVVGISPDAPEKLAKFRDKEKLNFPLLSDPDHATMEAYGAWGEKMLYGKKAIGVIRSTVVVDADGLVERAAYNVKATGHVAKLKRDLGLAS
jgi:thioredoxin-dependent peroxiredoxin